MSRILSAPIARRQALDRAAVETLSRCVPWPAGGPRNAEAEHCAEILSKRDLLANEGESDAVLFSFLRL